MVVLEVLAVVLMLAKMDFNQEVVVVGERLVSLLVSAAMGRSG